MESLANIAAALANNLFSQVAILIGLIALIGLLLQRKPFEQVIGGAVRATLGVVILNIGVDIFVAGLVAFQAIVSSAFRITPPTSASTMKTFLEGSGAVVPLVIALGFLIHLVLVSVFKAARYVYLTGHLMYWMSLVLVATLVEAVPGVDRVALIVVAAIVVACYWTLQPLWMEPLMKRAIGGDNFGLGHTTSSLALLSGYGAKVLRLGDPGKHDTEKIRMPKAVAFFKDINVSTVFVIGVIMIVAILFAEDSVVVKQLGDSNMAPMMWGFVQALRFAGGIAILLYGVRMFLAEIVPAFRGISQKLLPGSRPALDIPTVFPKAPTAVMIGFLASISVFLICMGIFAAAGWFALVPPMIMLFFGGGAGGVFGNATAGWRGAVFGGALNGLILAFGQWIGWGFYSSTAPELATLADPDWYAVGWLFLGCGKAFGHLGSGGLWALGVVTLIITAAVLLLINKKTKAPAGDAEQKVADK